MAPTSPVTTSAPLACNFQRLMMLPYEIVKLDRSLLLQAVRSTHALNMLTGLVKYLQRLGMAVVCEGGRPRPISRWRTGWAATTSRATPTPFPPSLPLGLSRTLACHGETRAPFP